jgi:hypothetical protein
MNNILPGSHFLEGFGVSGTLRNIQMVSFKISQMAMRSRINYNIVIYSASMVENAIWVCIFENQSIFTPE